MSGDDLSI